MEQQPPSFTSQGMATYRHQIIKLSALLYFCASLIATIVVLAPPVRESSNLTIALLLTTLGIFTAFVVYAFPWQRYHPNWFMVIGTIASIHIGVFIWSTGGVTSPFWPYELFVVLASTAYYNDRWPIVVLTILSVAVLSSPLVYQDQLLSSYPADLTIRITVTAISFVIGRWLFRSLEHTMQVALQLSEEQHIVAERRQFASVVTHELKNLLTPVMGFGELLEGQPGLSDQAKPAVKEIVRGSRRMQQLIREIEDANIIDAGLKLQKEVVDVEAIIREEVTRWRFAALDHLFEIEVNYPDPKVSCDPERIRRVIANLVGNAVKYSASGTTVSISLESSDHAAMVAVRDQGVGIPPEVQGKLFSPFYRGLRASIAGISGTGLGLSICKSIVEAHGGHIAVTSQEGHGSVFTFTIPLTTPSAA